VDESPRRASLIAAYAVEGRGLHPHRPIPPILQNPHRRALSRCHQKSGAAAATLQMELQYPYSTDRTDPRINDIRPDVLNSRPDARENSINSVSVVLGAIRWVTLQGVSRFSPRGLRRAQIDIARRRRDST
jgi:hypothetical protein